MATKRSQRIGIWVITGALAIGTIGGFVAMVLSSQNQSVDEKRAQKMLDEYNKANKTYQEKTEAQQKELSDKYYATFVEYKSRVGAFEASDVKELGKEDLVQGNGEELTEESTFTAYYMGWNPSGEIFDSSLDGESLKAPFEAAPGSVIKGWTQGVAGMKVGGIRELTIPSDLAYGKEGSGDKIPANAPLKFVIMVIPAPEKIAQPDIPPALLKYYQTGSF